MRVLLADDHRLLLEGLSSLLAANGIDVVGQAHDGVEAVALARALRPEIVLMDLRMPGGDGLTATRRIKAELPETRVVILTTSTDEADLFEAVKSGACGYLLKSMSADELIDSLHGAQQGAPPFSPGLAEKLLGEFARLAGSAAVPSADAAAMTETPALLPVLTERQREVLQLVAAGLTYKEVGARLNLSPHTVKYHMAEIMAALHLEHRAQVLAYAGKQGLGDRD
ncbi:MAG: response regulator transcription factor [Candidatus Promineofilum sp.]|nr:response regulator transcription factor [Promineifilum sp.]MCW5864800.1 response regulator transcription factor [Anaerolineae bacterium]